MELTQLDYYSKGATSDLPISIDDSRGIALVVTGADYSFIRTNLAKQVKKILTSGTGLNFARRAAI